LIGNKDMKTILVTGGSGFAGQHLIEMLSKEPCDIHVIDRTRIAACGENRKTIKITNHLIDLEQPERLRECIRKINPQEVYHLAGRANVKSSWFGEAETYKTNVIGAINLLTALRDTAQEADTLVISSGEVYGLVPDNQQPITESRLPAPRSPYAASKYCQEIACSQIAHSLNGKVVIARPFNHIGPGQRLGFVTADFACQVAKIENGQQEPVIRVGNLNAQRDFSDVRDTVNGYINALRNGETGQVINVSSAKSGRVKDFLAFFLSQSSKSISIEIDKERFRPVDVPMLTGSHDLLTRISGWKPERDILDTLREILDYWRHHVADQSNNLE